MRKVLPATLVALTILLYAGVAGYGLWLKHRSLPWTRPNGFGAKMAWHPESAADLPAAQRRDVEYGRLLFNETPVTALPTPSHASPAETVISAMAPPILSASRWFSAAYPQFSKRAGRSVTLQDRVQECMTRSENAFPFTR